ncbi:monooxygenase 2-like [Elaeis guineensis]|uniref:Monooxygenase 2 n=1 Tax=Elaeis guineensis var. tenera TaxID=51953 RepID=A0A6I9R3B6_ELAGV|nr:monooxygenase 2 [Elaeis guineensis]
MATSFSSPLLHLLRPSPFSASLRPTRITPERRIFTPFAGPSDNPRKEEVVVVGAGIAGLATALSLHRVGVRSVVLEQGDSLRTGGTSLTLFKNGWRALDDIGVGDELRSQFLQIQGLVMRSEDGRELRSFSFKEEAPGQEVRAVERRVLLETLASRLPPNTISFSSRLKYIERQGSEGTLLELDDGSRVLAKLVIACDGVHSPVAKWMGFSEPNYVGHCAFRGLGLYPDGQPFKPTVNYIYGRGMRAGFVPVSSTKVYWFICFNSPSPGPRTSDPYVLKQEALDLVRSWPQELLDVMQKTPEDVVIKTPLADRWLWPGFSPPAWANGVVVVGDAWHPMTPNLGQGACCALEDAVVLGSKLRGVIGGRSELIDQALSDYTQERWARVFPLTIRANLVGSLLQWENPVVCSFRNNIMIPKLVRLGPFLEHTNFECELLEPAGSP